MIKSVFTTKIETWVGLLVIVFIAVSLGTLVFTKISDFNNYIDTINSDYYKEGVLVISLREMKRIEKWIKKNDLNRYGDSMEIVYAGGNPLFNENTGESISRFDYIVKKHQERPWRTRN